MKVTLHTGIYRFLGMLTLVAAVAGFTSAGSAQAAGAPRGAGPCLSCSPAPAFTMDPGQSHIWVQPGQTVLIPLTLNRGTSLTGGPLKLGLFVADDQFAGVSLSQTDALLLPGDSVTFWAKVQVPATLAQWVDNIVVKAVAHDVNGNTSTQYSNATVEIGTPGPCLGCGSAAATKR